MLAPQGPAGYGLGFALRKDLAGGEVKFGHSGWDEGFVADLVMFKEQSAAAAIMLNSNQGSPLLQEVVEAIAAAYDWPTDVPRTPAEPDERMRAAVCGSYETEGEDWRFVVADDGDGVVLRVARQAPIRLEMTEEMVFKAPALRTTLRFRTEQGSVASVDLDFGGRTARAHPVAG